MTDIILIAILLIIVSAICLYLYKQKKRGKHCIGCPYAKKCENRQRCQTTDDNE